MNGYLANILFLACCWIFLLAVAGSIALNHWHRREAADAAETERVISGLKSNTTHDHIWDA